MFPDAIKQNMLKIGLFLALIFGIAFGWVSFQFQVKNVYIERNESTINVRSGSLLQIMEYVKKTNILVLKTDSLEEHFVKTFKELESVSIEKKYPDSLSITVVPLDIIAKWEYFHEQIEKANEQTDGQTDQQTDEKDKNNKTVFVKKTGYLNKNNLFLEHSAMDENIHKNLLTIVDKQPRKKEISFYDIVSDGRYISQIVKGKENLELVISRKIVEINYYRDAQEVYFIDDKGVEYWLYLEEDLSVQIKKLKHMLDEKNILKWRLDYIDLRINGKVIYKFDE